MEKLNHKMYTFADKFKKQIKYIAIALCILIFLLRVGAYGLSSSFWERLWIVISDIRYCFPIRSFSGFIWSLSLWVFNLSPLFLAYAVFREKQSLRIGTIIIFIAYAGIRVIESISVLDFGVYFAYRFLQFGSYLLLLYAIDGRKQSIMTWSLIALACYLLSFFIALLWLRGYLSLGFNLIELAPILILPIYSMAYYQKPLIFSKPTAKSKAQPAISSSSKINTLTKAKELLDAGIITQEEFEAKKKEILGL